MEGTRRTLQLMRIAMLFSIMIYGVMIKFVPSNVQANPVIFYVIVLLAIWIVAALFLFQRKYVKASESVLARDSGDLLAQKRWRLGYLLTYAFSEAIALYGVVLHFLGFTAAQVAPFLIAGAVLILFYSPRLPVSSANS